MAVENDNPSKEYSAIDTEITIDNVVSLISVSIDSACENDDGGHIVNTLCLARNLLKEVKESLERLEEERITSRIAYREWYRAPADPEGETHSDKWNPELISYIEQTAQRIGELSKEFARDRMTRLAADRVNKTHEVDEVIDWLKGHTYSARPLLLDNFELHHMGIFYQLQQETAEKMLKKIKELQAENIPSGKLGIIESETEVAA